MNLRRELEKRLSRALADAGAPAGASALVMPPARPEFGDYQANGAMAAAKQLKMNPRELAQKVLDAAELDDIAGKLEIAGPGFINVTLREEFLAGQVAAALGDERCGAEQADQQTIVVDYSSPNIAKEMHVGHLRSTIIGDALARTLEFLGHKVIRQNHVGDWGTQFGMLIAHLEELGGDTHELANLVEFYKIAKGRFDSDPGFAQRARRMVVQLQSGDEQVTQIWQRFIELSLRHCQEIYARLNVTLMPSDVRGESAYNDDLSDVVEALDAAGLLQESEGAKCVFLEAFKNKNGEPLPVIVRKSDGGYLYATTDLAAMRYRNDTLHADRILYVTDSRQILHFQQVFAVARKAGFVEEHVSLEHVPFGTMQGPDGKPFKTRSGEPVLLLDLLNEAELRAADLVAEKNPDLDEALRQRVATAVGIGAVKYSDLQHHRTSDYTFSWDKMLSLDGNTAPYMQYAYARVRSIFRKGRTEDPNQPLDEDQVESIGAEAISLEEPAERALAVKLSQFAETVELVARDALPHLLCGYLFEVAGTFMSFYESCPVLQAEPNVRLSRLALCDLTARIMREGLGLLGIEVIEQM